MAKSIVNFDDAAAPGSRFPSTAVRDEIRELAPSVLDPGAVGETELAAGAVTTVKLDDEAVTSDKIALKGVEAANLADEAVDTPALADRAVTADKAGLGVLTGLDANGNPVSIKAVICTAAEYAAMAHNPNTLYFCTA